MSSSLLSTLNISRQDMMNRIQDLDTIGNNLANINTAGFRSSRMNFQELLKSKNLGGTTLASTQIITGQGELIPTENPYDWAIQGDGFFPVEIADGQTAYTRDGMFHLDANAQLVNSGGHRLSWQGQIPAETTDISIDESGAVIAYLADGTHQQIGTLQLARFANPSGLISSGDNLWLASDASGEALLSNPGENGSGTIQSHAYEGSNVNLADEMTHIIQVQRGFQMTSRVFQQTDTMISQAIHLRKA